MHACKIRDTFYGALILHFNYACWLYKELLHALENFGIFSALFGIYFDFISI